MTVDAYQDLAGTYDEILTESPITPALRELVVNLIPDFLLSGQRRTHVVDLCCGTGLITSHLNHTLNGHRSTWHVTGVDRSQAMLETASGRFDRVILADATETGLKESSADLTLNTFAWTDVSDWNGVIAEATRITVLGGHLIVAGPHPAFFGPHVNKYADPWELHSGYYRHGVAPDDAPGHGPFRKLVGYWHHLTIPTLLKPVLRREWKLEDMVEAAGDPPLLLGFRARRIAGKDEV